MNIVGFNFTKISGERKRAMTGQVKINNNIRLDRLTEAKIGIGDGDRQAIKLTFEYTSEYAPDMAHLSMLGDVLILLDKKLAVDTLKSWKDKKHIPGPVAQRVMNHILERCNIQALLMAKDLNLPSPVPMPRAQIQAADKKAPAKTLTKKKAKK